MTYPRLTVTPLLNSYAWPAPAVVDDLVKLAAWVRIRARHLSIGRVNSLTYTPPDAPQRT